MKPTETEPICLISYEVARILLGGGPDTRPSFWKAYRRELELNQKTNYDNYHIRVCKEHLVTLRARPEGPVYYRHGRLTQERGIPSPVLEQLC